MTKEITTPTKQPRKMARKPLTAVPDMGTLAPAPATSKPQTKASLAERLLQQEGGVSLAEAGQLRTMFATAHLLAGQLRELGKVEPALRSLVAAMTIRANCIEVLLSPNALGIEAASSWARSIPPPTRRPFREAKLRIDADASTNRASDDLLDLVADAMDAQRLVLASPALSLNQLAKQEG